MKKLFLFTMLSALAVSLNSCSGDDNASTNNNNSSKPGGTVSVKIDGVQKTFNNVVVNQDASDADGDVFLTVTASQNGNTTEYIVFEAYQGEVGANAAYFNYTRDGQSYGSMSINEDSYEISSIIQTNANNKLTGTFSGRLIRQNGPITNDVVTFTNGTFDVKY